jgi:hypothetical protein
MAQKKGEHAACRCSRCMQPTALRQRTLASGGMREGSSRGARSRLDRSTMASRSGRLRRCLCAAASASALAAAPLASASAAASASGSSSPARSSAPGAGAGVGPEGIYG